jgi:DNA-binding GntR family transcriptional regulator
MAAAHRPPRSQWTNAATRGETVRLGNLAPVEKDNLSSRVYLRIREALVNGQFEPGERLTIGALAKEMGVSSTPVREAIFRLISEQALDMKAATAVHVPIITASNLREIQLIRHLLEGAAAEAAATRITEAELRELEKIQAAFVKAAAVDPKLASFHNRQFHFAIMAAARLPTVYAIVESLWVSMGPLLQIFHIKTPRRDLTKRRHRHAQVLRALAQHDPEKARFALQADIAWGQIMVDWLEEKEAAVNPSSALKDPIARRGKLAPQEGEEGAVVRPRSAAASL